MRPKALLPVALVGVLALTVACSDGGDDTAADPTTPPATTTDAAGAGTIVDLASATPTLSTLTAAVGAADLATTLQQPGPYTVFAPTDDAFAALPAGVVDTLLLPCNKDALTSVLTYHVVAAEVPSSAITPGPATTVEGSDVTIDVQDGTVTVDGATVVQADVEADNGVVHVIDAVLLPDGLDPADLPTAC